MARLSERPDALRDLTLVPAIAEDLSLAADAAATIRELSADGSSLRPLCAYDPDPGRRQAMAAIMARTESTTEGLWSLVMRDRTAVRLDMSETGHRSASRAQDDFVVAHGIRAVLGAPLLAEDQIVGTVALVRFGTGRSFGESDLDLVAECALLLAGLIAARRPARN